MATAVAVTTPVVTEDDFVYGLDSFTQDQRRRNRAIKQFHEGASSGIDPIVVAHRVYDSAAYGLANADGKAALAKSRFDARLDEKEAATASSPSHPPIVAAGAAVGRGLAWLDPRSHRHTSPAPAPAGTPTVLPTAPSMTMSPTPTGSRLTSGTDFDTVLAPTTVPVTTPVRVRPRGLIRYVVIGLIIGLAVMFVCLWIFISWHNNVYLSQGWLTTVMVAFIILGAPSAGAIIGARRAYTRPATTVPVPTSH